MLEKDVIKKIRSWLKTIDGCWCVKNYGHVFARIGLPDLFIVYRGRLIAIETKATGKEPTDAQHLTLNELKKAGAYAAWFDSPSNAIAWLKQTITSIDRELS